MTGSFAARRDACHAARLPFRTRRLRRPLLAVAVAALLTLAAPVAGAGRRRPRRTSASAWAPTASWRRPTPSSATSSSSPPQSDRVEIVDIGPTTDGHRTIAAIVSAPENIQQPRADSRRQPAAGRSAHAAAGRGAPAGRDAQGRARDRRQHPRLRNRRDAGGERAALHAGDRRPMPRRSTSCRTSSSS